MYEDESQRHSLRGFAIAISLLMWIFTYYFFMPTFAFGFVGVTFLVLVTTVIFWLANFERGKTEFFIFLMMALYFVFAPFLTSIGLFHASEYHSLIGKVTESQFTQDIMPVDPSQIRIINQSVATRIGEKKLGEDPALGSRAQLGTMHIQQVRGQLYWVGPILHSGFWKWKSFDSTPGYVMVSATNPQDVQYVTHVKGKEVKIRYQEEAYFGDNLERHLYQNGYMIPNCIL